MMHITRFNLFCMCFSVSSQAKGIMGPEMLQFPLTSTNQTDAYKEKSCRSKALCFFLCFLAISSQFLFSSLHACFLRFSASHNFRIQVFKSFLDFIWKADLFLLFCSGNLREPAIIFQWKFPLWLLFFYCSISSCSRCMGTKF